MSTHPSAFIRRFRGKMDEISALCRRLTLKDAATIQRVFVAALKEEVEARYGPSSGIDANYNVPLRIAGLGSFKMKTRPARGFPYPPSGRTAASGAAPYTMKPASRRLAFTSKWEEIK